MSKTAGAFMRWAAVCVLLPFPAIRANASADDAATARQIYRSVTELEARRADASAAAAERSRQRQAVQEQIERLEFEFAAIDSQVAELREEVGSLESRGQKYREEIARITDAATMLGEAAGQVAGRMRDRIARGVSAERQERLLAIESALVQMGGDDVHKTLDGLAGLAAVALGELHMSGGRHLRNEPVTLDGRLMHAYIYRLGLLSEGFLSEDGHEAGILDPDSGRWQTAPDLHGPVAAIVAIMRQRQPSAWVTVPVTADVEPRADTSRGNP